MKFLPSIFRFGPDWLFANGFALGFSSSKSSQSTSSSTTNQVTDQRAAASEGSIAAGAGATVNVQSTDPQAFDAIEGIANQASVSLTEGFSNSAKALENTAGRALDANTDVATAALTTGQRNLETAADLGTTAIGAGVAQTRDALDFGERALQIATNSANQSQAATNDLIQRTNEQFTAKLAANAGDAPQAVAQDAIKYGAFALVALVGVLILFRPTAKAA